MKTQANDPISHMTGDEDILNKFMGLTKREYFAALALQGLTSAMAIRNYKNSEIAQIAVAQADALIAELNKESK